MAHHDYWGAYYDLPPPKRGGPMCPPPICERETLKFACTILGTLAAVVTCWITAYATQGHWMSHWMFWVAPQVVVLSVCGTLRARALNRLPPPPQQQRLVWVDWMFFLLIPSLMNPIGCLFGPMGPLAVFGPFFFLYGPFVAIPLCQHMYRHHPLIQCCKFLYNGCRES